MQKPHLYPILIIASVRITSRWRWLTIGTAPSKRDWKLLYVQQASHEAMAFNYFKASLFTGMQCGRTITPSTYLLVTKAQLILPNGNLGHWIKDANWIPNVGSVVLTSLFTWSPPDGQCLYFLFSFATLLIGHKDPGYGVTGGCHLMTSAKADVRMRVITLLYWSTS